jgi:hypothetical protein
MNRKGDLPTPEDAALLAEDIGDEKFSSINAAECSVSLDDSFPSNNAD